MCQLWIHLFTLWTLLKETCHRFYLSNISNPTLKPLIGCIIVIVQPPIKHVAQAILHKVTRVLVVSLNLIQLMRGYTQLLPQPSPFSCYWELHEILQSGTRNSHWTRLLFIRLSSPGGGATINWLRSNSRTGLGTRLTLCIWTTTFLLAYVLLAYVLLAWSTKNVWQ